MGVEPAYETIGATYGATRDEDPRIARRIRKALGDAESVVNIGLGEIRRVARRRAVIFTCDPAFPRLLALPRLLPVVRHACAHPAALPSRVRAAGAAEGHRRPDPARLPRRLRRRLLGPPRGL